MTRKLIALLVLSLGVLFCSYSHSSSEAGVAGQAAKKNAEGRKLFIQYCATCHGAEAKGDGPTARALKKAPADLTKVEKVDGKFPSVRIQRIIAGDDMLESHGSRDMPVWGTVLRQKVGAGFARLEIYNLTNYIESIQQ
jgi:mono/diheme cytochrome c family protein